MLRDDAHASHVSDDGAFERDAAPVPSTGQDSAPVAWPSSAVRPVPRAASESMRAQPRHARTPSNSLVPPGGGAVLAGATPPLQQWVMTPPLSGVTAASKSRPASDERPTALDVSALSPHEYPLFLRWVQRMKPAHSRRHGYLDEYAAVKFVRTEFGISVDDEVKIMSLFERLPLGLTAEHFFAILRLASWTQQGRVPCRDLLFTQTVPPEARRRRHGPMRVASTTSMPDTRRRTSARALPTPRSPMQLPAPMLGDVPKAPPRQVPDDDERAPGADADDERPRSPENPRLVRPTPVVARASSEAADAVLPTHDTLPPLPTEELLPVPRAPDKIPSPALLRAALDRPNAPLPQVSPLIQASLNARSEVKKASRQATRPKTFTVLSSSSGQVERDKPRLLTGQEAPRRPQALWQGTKRRTHSLNKMSSLAALQETSEDFAGCLSTPRQTVAPKPSYIGRADGILPAWLREQQEGGNAPPLRADGAGDPAPSVFEALDHKVQESLSSSEHAAASINRNTPFFPPHKRDLERVAQAHQDGSAAEHYRELNAQTSAHSESPPNMLGDGRTRALLARPRGPIGLGGNVPGVPRRRVDTTANPWGTMLDSGTYAGFKSTPSTRDLRLLTPGRDAAAKRPFQHHYPPNQEFQPNLAPPTPGGGADTSITEGDVAMPRRPTQERSASDISIRSLDSAPPRKLHAARSQEMQPARSQEMQRFVLQGDATRPQLPHNAPERKPSGPLAARSKAALRDASVLHGDAPPDVPEKAPSDVPASDVLSTDQATASSTVATTPSMDADVFSSPAHNLFSAPSSKTRASPAPSGMGDARAEGAGGATDEDDWGADEDDARAERVGGVVDNVDRRADEGDGRTEHVGGRTDKNAKTLA
ncbi:hypothetical protein MSPP1_003401 [Malassezia sp. CBS 17886]|nr:hypothetical protein MSPP1_003401 [Malassezia sp. CBS 17886]